MKHSAHLAALVLTAVTLNGCSPTLSRSDLASISPEKISYEIGACRGFCPSYGVVVTRDAVTFTGERHTLKLGTISLRSGPSLFRDVARELEAIRPEGPTTSVSRENCDRYATDHQTVTVKWESRARGLQSLSYDLGCHDPAYASIKATLASVRRLLPIDTLVGRSTTY